MRNVLTIIILSWVILSFSAINAACLEASFPDGSKKIEQISTPVVPQVDGWWTQSTDKILQKFKLRCQNMIERGVEIEIRPEFGGSREVAFAYATERFRERAELAEDEFWDENYLWFTLPLEEALKAIEPCCTVRYNSQPCAFQGEYCREIPGIPILSITINKSEFRPTIQYCTQMLLSAGKKCLPSTLCYFFQTLGLGWQEKSKVSTLDLMKVLFSHASCAPTVSKQYCKTQLLTDLKHLTANYKIHFMPFDRDLINFLAKLIDEIRKNPDIRAALTSIKILPIPEQMHELKVKLYGADCPYSRFPKVVLYCYGRKKTQKALNILYKIFASYPGIGRAPAYNVKVTDLIYFTQGDRQDKILFPEWFDKYQNMICFSRAAIDYVAGCNFSHDYGLKNPADA